MAKPLVVYGAYGFTGRLVAEALVARGLRPILAGRDGGTLRAVAGALGLDWQRVDLADGTALRALLGEAAGVLHCAGPFADTAARMRNACLATGAHYVDITGEPDVLEASLALDAPARAAGILILSGGGFDVVPTDCLAAMLKAAMPDATHLRLAFTSSGGSSRGTMRTGARYLAAPVLVRRGGVLLARTDLAAIELDFGGSRRRVRPFTWGDVVTAWHSTAIPDIETYMEVPAEVAALTDMPWIVRRLLQSRPGRWISDRAIARQPEGPDAARRDGGEARVYGQVRNAAGKCLEMRLRTAEAYKLTALAMAEIGARILAGAVPTGARTPATAFGADFVLSLPGSTLLDG